MSPATDASSTNTASADAQISRRSHLPAVHIAVAGSINMDLVARCAVLPRTGETVAGREFHTTPGGKGANQAIAAARAGADDARVSLLGAVGTDAFAKDLIATLKNAGIRTGRVRQVEGPSGTAHITVDDAAENTIVVVPGANGTVTSWSTADEDVIRNADLVMLQLEIPMTAVVQAAAAAAGSGVPVLLNPSPMRPLPKDLLRATTMLVVNEGEAAELGEQAAAVPHVVTTLGAAGARYRGPDGVEIAVAAPQVNALDTTGAGDAFTGALAVAWAWGASPERALVRACAAGALAATVLGASASAPTRDAIDRLIEAGQRGR